VSVLPLIRRQELVLAALLAAALAAWAFIIWLAVDMGRPLARLTMPISASWSLATAAAVIAMWSVMMTAMMLPSAVPMVLIFARLSRRTGWAATWVFTGAYILTWAGFGALAAAVQWALQAAGLVSPMAMSVSPAMTAVLLIAAGAFQFTPLKSACLTRCRSPIAFLMAEWRKGVSGAFIMGVRHGLYCVGCCWALMALLFAFGVMNLPLVAALAVSVALEKLAPGGVWIARAVGGVLIVAGIWILVAGIGTMTTM